MYIKRAQVDNFGKFHQKTFCFSPGLNVVYGENESGKSTLHSFLRGMMFGLEKSRGRSQQGDAYRQYEPWNVASYYSGSIEFGVKASDERTSPKGKTKEKSFLMERNFYHKEKTVQLYNQEEKEELSVEHGDLDMLLGGISRRIYENTCCIAQACVVSEANFAKELQQELVNHTHGGDGATNIRQSVKQLEGRKHQTEVQLKDIRQIKQQRMERLVWEQELLEEEILVLEQKLEDKKQKPKEEEPQDAGKKQNLLWKLPVIRWILGLLHRAWIRLRRNKQKKYLQQQKKEQEETASVWQILQEQLEEKKMRQFNLLEEIEENSVLSGKEWELQTESKALQLAIDTLGQVAKDSYREDKDKIQTSIARIFSEITEGAYDKLEVTEEGKVFLYSQNKCLEPWQLSRGTMEQLYFAIRLGMGRCLMQEELLPVLLDETFCTYDDIRLKRTLKWLSKQPMQIILFTSHRREQELLEELNIEYNRVVL